MQAISDQLQTAIKNVTYTDDLEVYKAPYCGQTASWCTSNRQWQILKRRLIRKTKIVKITIAKIVWPINVYVCCWTWYWWVSDTTVLNLLLHWLLEIPLDTLDSFIKFTGMSFYISYLKIQQVSLHVLGKFSLGQCHQTNNIHTTCRKKLFNP